MIVELNVELRLVVYEFILINLVLVTFKHYMCLKRLVKSSNNLIVFHIATTQHSDYTCRTTRHSILIINKNSLTLLTPCQFNSIEIFKLTEHIEQCKEFTKEISIGPKVVIFEIGIKIVEQKLLFLSLFCFTNDSKIQIHFEC